MSDVLLSAGLDLTNDHPKRKTYIFSTYHNQNFELDKNAKKIVNRMKEDSDKKQIVVFYTDGFVHSKAFMKINNLILFKVNTTYINFINEISNIIDKDKDSYMQHGSLMSLYGEGVLIIGKSGIGKSEVCLDLITRGHFFVADDAVNIFTNRERLQGLPSPALKNLIEVRGIGIVNVRKTYGIQSVLPAKKIDIIIEMKAYDPKVPIERLGHKTHYKKILGIEIPYVVIPIGIGKNVSQIVETAVINEKLRKYENFNAAEALLVKK